MYTISRPNRPIQSDMPIHTQPNTPIKVPLHTFNTHYKIMDTLKTI